MNCTYGAQFGTFSFKSKYDVKVIGLGPKGGDHCDLGAEEIFEMIFFVREPLLYNFSPLEKGL